MPTALEIAQQLRSRFGDAVSEPAEFRGEISVCVPDAKRIPEVMKLARDQLGFEWLLDICSVDHADANPRFEIVYHLYSQAARQYLRIKTRVGGEKPQLPTVSGIWKTANWHEREVFDMMGIRFTGHPDLRRILMWDEYPYHPLRKEFPLAGLPTEDGRADTVPMDGGPYVTQPSPGPASDREPRGKGESDRDL
jgi:NADH-quinone oxidoreductase subunit C